MLGGGGGGGNTFNVRSVRGAALCVSKGSTQEKDWLVFLIQTVAKCIERGFPPPLATQAPLSVSDLSLQSFSFL